MSLEYFQLLDKEAFDNSIVKRDFLKVYHQQGAKLNDSDHQVEFISGESNNYHQIGNAYLEFDVTVQDPNASFDNNSRIRLTKIGLAYVFQEAVLATTSGSNLEHNKFVGQTSTIIRVITSKDGDLLSQFDKINEGNTDDDFDSTSFEKMLIDKHNIAGQKVNGGKIKGQLPLEHVFGFCMTLKIVKKNLGFHINFETANLQNSIYTSIADGTQFNITIDSL